DQGRAEHEAAECLEVQADRANQLDDDEYAQDDEHDAVDRFEAEVRLRISHCYDTRTVKFGSRSLSLPMRSSINSNSPAFFSICTCSRFQSRETERKAGSPFLARYTK